MQEWIQHVFDSPEYGLFIVPPALLLGLVGALTSCCSVPVLALITGYSGTREETGRGTIVVTGLFFMIGTIVALCAIGAVAGFISQVAGSVLGRYWRLFAGMAAIVFGVVSLDLLPWKLPKMNSALKPVLPGSYVGAAMFGLVVGGGTLACTLSCNPALPAALGIAVLQGQTVWGMVILTAFAVGYSFPLAAVLVGISLGKSTLLKSGTMVKIIRYLSGTLLIGIGFYLLVTI